MQEQRRRTQNVITGAFLAVLVVVAALIVWNVVPRPAPAATQPATYGLLSDFTKNGKTNIKSQEAPVKLADDLQYADVKVGTGQAVKATDTITVNYTGWLTDGTKFDSSLDRGQPAQFPLNGGVIKGWTEGLVGMKVGGERRLFIPAALAYGANPPSGSNIPANAILIFDVSLVSIP
ncbi:MAG: FKBP-type peptidyl-prolyl cis-trans isomerase [Ktedonobacteraceae bacterium]|nr:FKBP-type peptidyl-prolyl cis-trans isomerase [Ktedonobacteraceae bacterium]MBA3825190.1 FKBP-type peptidyl-prolyl cis-trans isomerase [Ktedonobacterales bacterium]